ncbi:universal stress protein [Salinigranum sp. GCM10025319]|uniref:universal stress protein n=1 Tax=Salinigranum sp. GCM10025319 TaxID=3252687 RepID=UPI0036192841
MFETIVIATDGSESVQRAVDVALDLSRRFDAAVHAISIVDTDEVESSPERLQEEMETALKETAEEALSDVRASTDLDVTTAVLVGRPAVEIREYADAHDADLVAMGTRGRHGENRFLLGSVAERVVRTCPMPVLTVRQLAEDETA